MKTDARNRLSNFLIMYLQMENRIAQHKREILGRFQGMFIYVSLKLMKPDFMEENNTSSSDFLFPQYLMLLN